MLIKKTVSCAFAILFSLPMSADDIKILTLGLGELGEEPQLMGLGISPDGRHLSGIQKGINILRRPDGSVTKILK